MEQFEDRESDVSKMRGLSWMQLIWEKVFVTRNVIGAVTHIIPGNPQKYKVRYKDSSGLIHEVQYSKETFIRKWAQIKHQHMDGKLSPEHRASYSRNIEE